MDKIPQLAQFMKSRALEQGAAPSLCQEQGGPSPGAPAKPMIAPAEVELGSEADDIVFSFTCSKGDKEYHSVKDSFTGVREHEERHIQEYNDIARKLGVRVVQPHINVYSQYFPELKRQVATGGDASCRYVALIDGQEVEVPVSTDGYITNSAIAQKLDEEKKRRAAGDGPEGAKPDAAKPDATKPGGKSSDVERP